MSTIPVTGIWAQVAAANNNTAITDATFSCPTFNAGGGVYFMTIGPNTNFWCKAPNYSTTIANTGSYTGSQVFLAYTGGWPQTY